MTKTIARGSNARPRKAPARGGKGSGRGKGGGASAVPETVRKISFWIFMAMLIAVAVAALAAFRVPALLGGTLGESVGEMGFSLKRVEIKGASHVPQLDVYNIAFDQASSAMPLVDLEATRQRLLRFGWVRDARVSRRMPDTLVVDIVERRPAAIWQHNQRLSLIDAEGVVLERVKLDAMPDLPLLVGPGANLHAAELSRLVEAAGPLKGALAGATWIGGRRWDLRFQSGEVLALPEGEEAAKKALARFVKVDQSTQLLGRGFVRFDMRSPRNLTVRLSNEPGSTVPEIAPETPPADASTGQPVDPAQTI